MNQNHFHLNLADRLIENNYDAARVRSRDNVAESTSVNLLAAGIGMYLRVTNKKPKIEKGENCEGKYQSRCKICKKKV